MACSCAADGTYKRCSTLGSTLARSTNLTLELAIPLPIPSIYIDIRITLAQVSKEACKGFYYSTAHNSKKLEGSNLSLIQRGNTHRRREQNMIYIDCNIYKQYCKMKSLSIY